jgi:hypothetical protein
MAYNATAHHLARGARRAYRRLDSEAQRRPRVPRKIHYVKPMTPARWLAFLAIGGTWVLFCVAFGGIGCV